MSRAVARYRPSRRYAMFALAALAAAALSAWTASRWGNAWFVGAAMFALTASLTFLLAVRPTIEIHETHLRIGRRVVFWNEIERVDRIAVTQGEPWTAPLLLRLTVNKGRKVMLLHPGDVESCVGLLRNIYHYSRGALLDGVPYAEFWGERPAMRAPLALPPPRLLLPEDEAEIERMFQRLKTGGRLDEEDQRAGQSSGPGGDRGSDET